MLSYLQLPNEKITVNKKIAILMGLIIISSSVKTPVIFGIYCYNAKAIGKGVKVYINELLIDKSILIHQFIKIDGL